MSVVIHHGEREERRERERKKRWPRTDVLFESWSSAFTGHSSISHRHLRANQRLSHLRHSRILSQDESFEKRLCRLLVLAPLPVDYSGTGRMRHLKDVSRRFKNGFR